MPCAGLVDAVSSNYATALRDTDIRPVSGRDMCNFKVLGILVHRNLLPPALQVFTLHPTRPLDVRLDCHTNCDHFATHSSQRHILTEGQPF